MTKEFSVSFIKGFCIFIFRERVREGAREEEKHQCVVASCMSPTRDPATTQACALTGNQSSDPLVCRPVLSPLSHTSQGESLIYLILIKSK